MDKTLTVEELGEDLCEYCKCSDYGNEDYHGEMKCYGGEPVGCEGMYCKEAYENYLDDFKEEHRGMTNIEKAEKANELAEQIKEHEVNINTLEKRQKMHNNKEYKFSVGLRGFNDTVYIEADNHLINEMIAVECARAESAEKELDDLLNGNEKEIRKLLSQGDEQ